MIGATLTDIRQHIETLATAGGEYYLVSAATGEIPVPASGLRFPDRPTARAAARATEQYRSALRRYDPELTCYSIVVCQDPGTARAARSRTAGRRDRPRTTSEGVDSPFELPARASTAGRSELVECCHRVAGAVFETLSAHGHAAVESAVMDAYFELAERLSTPDGLCLCLLESMAVELDARLSPADQSRLLRAAATRLPSVEPTAHPLSATLAVLEAHGLLEADAHSPWAPCSSPFGHSRSVVVRLSTYALAPQDGRLPILPFAVECYRHWPDWQPSSVAVVDAKNGWELQIEQAADADPSGLVNAPIVEA